MPGVEEAPVAAGVPRAGVVCGGSCRRLGGVRGQWFRVRVWGCRGLGCLAPGSRRAREGGRRRRVPTRPAWRIRRRRERTRRPRVRDCSAPGSRRCRARARSCRGCAEALLEVLARRGQCRAVAVRLGRCADGPAAGRGAVPGRGLHAVRVGDLPRGRRHTAAVTGGAGGIRRLRRAVGLGRGAALGRRTGTRQCDTPVLPALLHSGRGTSAGPIRGDRPGPRGPDVPAGLQSAARSPSRGPVAIARLGRGHRQPTGRPRLYRGPSSSLGVITAGAGSTSTGPNGRRARARATGELSGPADAARATDTAPGPGLALVSVLGRGHRVVPAQRLFRRPHRQSGQHHAAVVADEHRAGGDVPVDPAMGVQHAQCHEDVGGDLGRPVRRHRLLGEQCGQRSRGHELAHYPQRAALGEHVEDLVEPRMIGDPRRGLRRLDGPPHGGITGPTGAGPRRGPPPRPTLTRVPRGEALGQPLGVEDLSLDDLRQRHLPDQDFLSAVRVEGAGLGEFVLVGGRQWQAVAVGEHPTRIVVHVASPAARLVNSVRLASLSGTRLDAHGPQAFTIRAGGNPQRGVAVSHGSNPAVANTCGDRLTS